MQNSSEVAVCYNVGRAEAQAACNLLQKVDREVRKRLEDLVRTTTYIYIYTYTFVSSNERRGIIIQ